MGGSAGVGGEPTKDVPNNLDVSKSINLSPSVTAAQRVQLRTQLQLQEAGVLNQQGRLTQGALANSYETTTTIKGVLRNPSVVKELTKNGTKIEDWGKFTTTSVERVPSGNVIDISSRTGKEVVVAQPQGLQVHFYVHRPTGQVNYTLTDFKVKNKVADSFLKVLKK